MGAWEAAIKEGKEGRRPETEGFAVESLRSLDDEGEAVVLDANVAGGPLVCLAGICGRTFSPGDDNVLDLAGEMDSMEWICRRLEVPIDCPKAKASLS